MQQSKIGVSGGKKEVMMDGWEGNENLRTE